MLVAVLQAYRLLSGRRGINETAVGQVRAMHWTMVLCHVETPEQVGPLLEDAIRWRESPASGRTHPVLYLERGITTGEAREQARSHSLTDDLSEAPPVFVVATPADLPLQPPDEPGRFRGSDLVLVLGGSALAFAVLATFIPGAESAYCSGSSCSGRPVTYGDALYWVFSRVLGGDPEGLGVANPWTRAIGLLLTIYGLVVLVGIIERVIQQQIDENLASGPSLVQAFNQKHAQRAELEKAKSRPDQQPRRRRSLCKRLRARARRMTDN